MPYIPDKARYAMINHLFNPEYITYDHTRPGNDLNEIL